MDVFVLLRRHFGALLTLQYRISIVIRAFAGKKRKKEGKKERIGVLSLASCILTFKSFCPEMRSEQQFLFFRTKILNFLPYPTCSHFHTFDAVGVCFLYFGQ